MENVTYPKTTYANYSPKKEIEGVEYRPPIIREKFQISLWRVDDYTCVKTRDKYFTPQNYKFTSGDCGSFKIVNSLDKETIILEESQAPEHTHKLVIILNAFTLEVVSEHLIGVKQPDLDISDADSMFDTNYDDLTSHYPTMKASGSLWCWSHPNGNYLFYGVTKPRWVFHYVYEVYDTAKKEVIQTIPREGFLRDNGVYDIKLDPENKETLYLVTHKDKDTHIVKINVTSGSETEVGSVTYDINLYEAKIFINESCTKIYICHTISVGARYYFKVHLADINKSTNINSTTDKGINERIPQQCKFQVCGNNLLCTYSTERNSLVNICMGQVSINITHSFNLKSPYTLNLE